jgi:KilA-N domain
MNFIKSWNSKTIRIREDRYVSLTDMASASGKLFGNWNQLKITTSYLTTLSSVIGIPVTELVQVQQGGKPSLQGTWGHPKVAIRFAQWCSDEFAVQVDFWIDELLTKGTLTINPKPSQSSHPYQRVWYQRLALFEQTTRIPVGYFCIFAEIAPLMRDLEAHSILLRDNATIDTSVGLCWNQWLRANNLFENFPLYPHTFPDNRGTINAKIYPDRLLPEFRSWLRMSYLNGNFPNYIKKQCSEDECLTIAKALSLEKKRLSA